MSGCALEITSERRHLRPINRERWDRRGPVRPEAVMDRIKWWHITLSFGSVAVVTTIFLFALVSNHEKGEHEALYKARYAGDSVARRIAEAETAANSALKDEVRDWEKRFGRVMDKLDQISLSVQDVAADVRVLKAQVGQ